MVDNSSLIKYGCFHPDYTEEIKYFNEGKVYSVQIESTLVCSQGCLYCYAADDSISIHELPKKAILEILDSAAMMEVRAIDWLGGDPLLRDDWYELLQYAKANGLKNNIWTSGIPLEDIEVAEKAVKASENGFISVHLDSLDEGIYKKLHTGDAKKKITSILKGVDNIISLGKKPENIINCITFTKIVAGSDVKKTIEYFFKEKGIRTCLTQMCMTGKAKDHNEWVPTIQEIKDACETREKSNYSKSNLSMSTMDVNKFYCGGTICVTIDGDVTPCSVIRKGFGNIYKASLVDVIKIHKDSLLLTSIRDPKNMTGYCSNCIHNAICWGCRATAYYEKGNMLEEDPKCYLNPHNYK